MLELMGRAVKLISFAQKVLGKTILRVDPARSRLFGVIEKIIVLVDTKVCPGVKVMPQLLNCPDVS